MKNKKMKTMLLSLGLVGVVGAGATFALFSAQTEIVTNTFTFGQGISQIKLEEKIVDPDTHKTVVGEGAGWRTENTYNKIQPAEVLDKEPTIKLTTDVPVYLFVSVENQDSTNLTPNIAEGNDWKFIKNDEVNANKAYYVYTGGGTEAVTVNPTQLEPGYAVFEKVTVSENIDDNNAVPNAKIIVNAAAVQGSIGYAQAEAEGLNLLK